MIRLCLSQYWKDLSADLDSSNLTVFDSVCLFHVSSDKNSYFEAFLVMVGASCQFVVSRLGQNLLSNLTNIDNNILFPIGHPTGIYLISNFIIICIYLVANLNDIAGNLAPIP